MRRPVRTALLWVSACLAAACLALFLWLPWNPFEADAGPLDAWVPADVDAVVRFDAGALRRADVVRTLWDGPAGRALRTRFDVDAKLDDVRRVDAQLAALPFAGDEPPTVERDFVGGEVLVALRGDDVLAMTRISGRAKAVDAIRRVGEERRKRWGVRIDGDAYVVSVGGGREIWFARRRDVLIASTSEELLGATIALAGGRGNPLAAREGRRDERPPAPRGARVGAWARGPFVRRLVGDPPIGAAALRPAFARSISLDVDATSAHSLRLVATIDGVAERDVSDLASTAGRLAVDGRTIAHGALPISARDAVAVLFDSQPPARRQLLGELLSESGSSTKQVVDDVAGRLEDGVGFVVARLPETDALRLDDPDGDPVEPIPATLAVFRLADAEPSAFLAALQKHAEALFGPNARLREEPGPGGARVFRAGAASFGPEWALLRPTVAIFGREVVFSTNDAYLRSALASAPSGAEASTAAVVSLDVAVLKKRLLDQRWDAADRATHHDWAAERRSFRKEQEPRLRAAAPQERERIEDEEIAARVRRRKTVEFPAALRDFAESLRWLDAFDRVECRLASGPGRQALSVEVGVRAP